MLDGRLWVAAERVQAGSFLEAPVQDYMNQYQQGAIDPALTEIQRRADIQRLGNNARSTAAGAYGGSRAALINTETDRNALAEIARTQAEGIHALKQGAVQDYPELGAADLVLHAHWKASVHRGFELRSWIFC